MSIIDVLIVLFYNIILYIYYVFIYICSFFNDKFSTWVRYQNKWKKQKFEFAKYESSVWIHVASVGELRMALPLIQTIKNENPDVKIVVSFFSVSIFNFLHLFDDKIDSFFLFPKEYSNNIQFIIDRINPKCLILVKNERWLNLLKITHQNNVDIFLVESDKLDSKNIIYNLYIKYTNKYIKKIFFDKDNSLRLQSVYDNNIVHTEDNLIHTFCADVFTIVLGSCYMEEVEYVANYFNNNQLTTKIILVPHEYNEHVLQQYQNYFDDKIGLYSKNEINGNLLMVDVYGKLNSIYQYANIAFVGGGFNGKLHNVFEPAVFGIPIIVGPKFRSEYHIQQAINLKLIDVVKTKEDLMNIIEYYKNNKKINFELKVKWNSFFNQSKSSSDIIWKEIKKDTIV